MDNTIALVFWGISLLIIGYFLPSIKDKSLSRTVVWSLIVITLFISVILTSEGSPASRTMIVVSLLLLSMKVIVVNETYSGTPVLRFWQWCFFSLAWFGMRPKLFETLPARSIPSLNLFIKGTGSIILGLAALYLSLLSERVILNIYFISYLLTLLGLSLILHFGILNLCTAAWRVNGDDVSELYREPYRSKSIKEFWGKRWNIAFSEMTSLIIFKPIRRKYDSQFALIVAFIFSGLLHELAISFPVNSGYGKPLCYFLIHACVLICEDKVQAIRNLLTHRFFRSVWVACWVILPLPLLFHQTFMTDVIYTWREEILSFLHII